jgi:hypothetical protein
MNKNVLFFAAGALLGSVVTYFVTQRRCEEIVQVEFDAMKAHIGRPYGTVKAKEEATKAEKKDYVKMVRRYDKGASYLEPVGDAPCDSDEDDNVRIISVEHYNETRPEYDKEILYFYEDDEVLVTEGEEIIDDVNETVGPSALLSFGEMSEDPEIVYVRNDNRRVDYEVIRLSKSYAEANGIGMEDGDEGNDD